MSVIQKLLTSILPSKWAAGMEAESRNWMVRCPSCGHTRSVWELGGIRWKATGNPVRYMLCPQCGKSGWHTVARQGDSGPASS